MKSIIKTLDDWKYETNPKSIGRAVSKIWEMFNVTQENLAKRANTSQKYLTKFKRKEHDVYIKTIARVIHALDGSLNIKIGKEKITIKTLSDMQKIGATLKNIREKKGIERLELAKQLGLTQSQSVEQVEEHTKTPRLLTLIKYAHALNQKVTISANFNEEAGYKSKENFCETFNLKCNMELILYKYQPNTPTANLPT